MAQETIKSWAADQNKLCKKLTKPGKLPYIKVKKEDTAKRHININNFDK